MWTAIAALVSLAISGIVIGSQKNGFDNYSRKLTGSGLTDAELEANAFSADQAAENRTFNAAQAAEQRAWAERMDSTRFQRATADMNSAGLNVAMMYGGGASPASTPSGATASGSAASAASSGAPDINAISSLINSLSGAAVNLSQAKKNEAEANVISIDLVTESEMRDWMLENLKSDVSKKNADTENALQQVRTGKAEEALKRAGISKTEAEAGLIVLQQVEQRISNENKQRLIDLQADLLKAQTNHEQADIERIDAEIDKIYAETLTEAYKQGALSAESVRSLAQAGLASAEGDLLRIDAKTRGLKNAVEIGVSVTQGLKNVTGAVDDISDALNPLKVLKELKRVGGKTKSSGVYRKK